MGRRIMSVWFPSLPLDYRRRLGDPRCEAVFAITAEIKKAHHITHMTNSAREAGLRTAMSVPDARAICPELLTEKFDPVRQDMLLRALRRWSDKLSPWIELDQPDGLLLDIQGCAHLLGGEEPMARQAILQFADMKLVTKIGIADTKGAAQALARYGLGPILISTQGQIKDDLKALPVQALQLSPKVTQDLHRLGFKTIGQLYKIKPSELARRFGIESVHRLSKTLGQSPDPLSPIAASPVFAARMNLPDPIGFKSDLQAVLTRLTHSVCSRLKRAKTGARHFQLTVRCVDTGPHHIRIGFARPCFDADTVTRQFERPLDRLKIEFGADWFRLVATTLETIQNRQRILGNQDQDRLEDLAQIITTLGNHLGFDRVRRFIPQDSHLPERAFSTIEAVDSNSVIHWPHSTQKRPFRIFRPERLRTIEAGRPPKIFEWRKQRYHTQIALGPERLSPEWWKDVHNEVKDYWAVETQKGARLWLMTYPGRPETEWFITGRFL